LQLSFGTLRPHKNEPGQAKTLNRKLFEIIHTGFGHVALVLALFAILSGIEQAYLFQYITNEDDYQWAALVPFGVYFAMLCLELASTLIRDTKAIRSMSNLHRVETSNSLSLTTSNNSATRSSINVGQNNEIRTPFLAIYVLACLLVVGLHGSDDD